VSKVNSGQTGPAGWRRCCLSAAAALLLAGCAAQNAYREGQTLLAADQVDAGLAKIQEAMPSIRPPLSIASAMHGRRNAKSMSSLARAERALVELRYDEAEAAYRRALALQPGNERALSGLR
jgi:general secretion pathway protein D